MNIIKHMDFFNPIKVQDNIHIIGVGAIGSTLAEMLARLGFEKLYIYDMDTVTEHNIANQMFRFNDIGEKKVVALEAMLKEINPNIEVISYDKGYHPKALNAPSLNGHVFLCVDNIDLRRDIVETNQYNPMIKVFYDFRMGLADAQHYAADWSKMDQKKYLLSTMQFSHAEAKAATPVSACGTTLSVVPTVRTVVAAGVTNFMNFCKAGELQKMVLVNPFAYITDAFASTP